MPMSMSGAAGCEAGWPCLGRAAGAAPVISFSVMVGAHSTGGGRLRPAAWLAAALLLAVLAAPVVAAPARPAPAPAAAPRSSAHWMQIESRIESGYFQQ